MKKIFSILYTIVLSIIFFASCKKDYDQVSTLKTVPSIQINGDRFISIRVGENFTDIGAAFTSENGETNNIQPDSNSVDINTPGLYILNYSRTTESNFSAADYRYVAVTNISDSADLSGEYLRAANNTINTITKKARGLYESENFGGSTLIVTAYFAQLDDTTIIIPEQPTSDGITSGEDATISYDNGDTTISYRVISNSFGDGIRTFVKQ